MQVVNSKSGFGLRQKYTVCEPLQVQLLIFFFFLNQNVIMISRTAVLLELRLSLKTNQPRSSLRWQNELEACSVFVNLGRLSVSVCDITTG